MGGPWGHFRDMPAAPKPNVSTMPHVRLRIVFADGRYFGPGKAELLQGIARTGTIAAAGREMGMSYKRAWDLVREMNAMFAAPLVVQSRGGAGGGGASLTVLGDEVLTLYRQFERASVQAGGDALAALTARLGGGLADK